MDDIGERIGKLIETLGIKKVRFAERLKIDQSYVTQLTNGKRKPSDRTISDICREFNVREEWLRYGNGDMLLNFTEDEFSKAATALSNDTFVRSLIVEYWKLDEDSKKLFKDFIHKLSDNMRSYEPVHGSTEDGSRTGADPTSLSIDEKLEQYRKELELEEKAEEESKALQNGA